MRPNLLAAAGLTGVCVAVGGLAGWPWGLLLAGVLAAALAVLGANSSEQPPALNDTDRILHQVPTAPRKGTP